MLLWPCNSLREKLGCEEGSRAKEQISHGDGFPGQGDWPWGRGVCVYVWVEGGGVKEREREKDSKGSFGKDERVSPYLEGRSCVLITVVFLRACTVRGT